MPLQAVSQQDWQIKTGIVIGTGPSLNDVADQVREIGLAGDALLFGINNTFRDFPLHCWIACDPAWHAHYGRVEGPFDKWHWDKSICKRFGYRYIEGRWFDGVSPYGSDWISLNHGSGPQALNLAVLYGCERILLVGHDMHYPEGQPRRYFSGLSDRAGEYPEPLRKWSKFEKPKREGGAHPDGDGILYNYKHIAEQEGLPEIINCTPGSAMKWFSIMNLSDALA